MVRKQYSKSDIKKFIESHPVAKRLMDKKSNVYEDDGVLYVQNKPVFFKIDSFWSPTLQVLLQQPDLLPSVTVDKGAIRFVVKGADVMRPGITKCQDFPADALVVIVDETVGKPIAVAKTLFSSPVLLEMTEGKVLINLHRVGDEIWNK